MVISEHFLLLRLDYRFWAFQVFLESVKGQKAAYGVIILSVIQQLSLKKMLESWKAWAYWSGLELNGSTDSILVFFSSHESCSHIRIIISRLNNCYGSDFPVLGQFPQSGDKLQWYIYVKSLPKDLQLFSDQVSWLIVITSVHLMWEHMEEEDRIWFSLLSPDYLNIWKHFHIVYWYFIDG